MWTALEAEWRTLWLALAHVALSQCEYAAAVGWCSFALERRPPPDVWPNAGLNGGSSTAAADGASATEGLSVEETVRALHWRARAHRNLGHVELAQEDVHAALALGPDEPGLVKLRAQLRRQRDRSFGRAEWNEIAYGMAEMENEGEDDEDEDEEESEEESEESDSEAMEEEAMEEEDDDEEDDDDEDDDEEESEETVESVEEARGEAVLEDAEVAESVS